MNELIAFLDQDQPQIFKMQRTGFLTTFQSICLKAIISKEVIQVNNNFIEEKIDEAITDHETLTQYINLEDQLDISELIWYFQSIQDHICGLGENITQIGILGNNTVDIHQVVIPNISYLGDYI